MTTNNANPSEMTTATIRAVLTTVREGADVLSRAMVVRVLQGRLTSVVKERGLKRAGFTYWRAFPGAGKAQVRATLDAAAGMGLVEFDGMHARLTDEGVSWLKSHRGKQGKVKPVEESAEPVPDADEADEAEAEDAPKPKRLSKKERAKQEKAAQVADEKLLALANSLDVYGEVSELARAYPAMREWGLDKRYSIDAARNLVHAVASSVRGLIAED